jgi:hypothetical protein
VNEPDVAAVGRELTGRCLCGTVRFVVGPPTGAGYCHCTRCQRRTGTASSISASVDGRTLRLLSGEESLRGWRHPDGGWEKFFCAQCGAHLFSRDPDNAEHMGIRMAAFDADPGVRASYRQFVNYAAAWEPIPEDGLERFGESRNRAEPPRA